jgi:hypothetical protein
MKRLFNRTAFFIGDKMPGKRKAALFKAAF